MTIIESYSVHHIFMNDYQLNKDIDTSSVDASIKKLLTSEKGWVRTIIEYIQSFFGFVTPGSVTDLKGRVRLLSKQPLDDPKKREEAIELLFNSLSKRVEILQLDQEMTALFAATLLDTAFAKQSLDKSTATSLALRCTPLRKEFEEISNEDDTDEPIEEEVPLIDYQEELPLPLTPDNPSSKSIWLLSAAALVVTGVYMTYQLLNSGAAMDIACKRAFDSSLFVALYKGMPINESYRNASSLPYNSSDLLVRSMSAIKPLLNLMPSSIMPKCEFLHVGVARDAHVGSHEMSWFTTAETPPHLCYEFRFPNSEGSITFFP